MGESLLLHLLRQFHALRERRQLIVHAMEQAVWRQALQMVHHPILAIVHKNDNKGALWLHASSSEVSHLRLAVAHKVEYNLGTAA